jgi:glycosyltransferase involved in cell wall biosynthesis
MNFYSIIVPAHNEEKCIAKTLTYLKALSYPKNLFEITVVENGSTDKSYHIAKAFSSEHFKIYSLNQKGVSHAKNFGASKANKKSDFLIFVDADTLLKKRFLMDIDSFLSTNANKNLSVGTTRILPIKKTVTSIYWFKFYDSFHKCTRSSYSLQIMRKKYFDKVKFDERLNLSEDLVLIRELQKYGRFFFVDTDQVETSTRRFEEKGWLKLALTWLYETILPKRMKFKVEYEVVR